MFEYGKYISVILPSMLKFILGPLTGFMLKLSWWETVLCTTIGMMVSVVICTYLGKAVQNIWQRWRKTPTRRFTRSSRRAVKVFQRFGIIGIACLTPLIFTPIGGTFLATSFKITPTKILLWMVIFGLFWSVTLTLAIYNIPGLRSIF